MNFQAECREGKEDGRMGKNSKKKKNSLKRD